MPDSSMFKSRARRAPRRSGVVVLFTVEERALLHRLAEARGVTTADLIRELIAREVSA